MNDPDETRIIRRSSGSSDEAMRTTDPNDPNATRLLGSDEETVIRTTERSSDDAATVIADGSEGATKLVGVPSSTSRGKGASSVREGTDFVRGWLAIVEGPGMGTSVEIGTGQNQVGRDRGNRISLPFGDESISRETHAVITYNPKERKFFLSNNQNSANLTYLNGDAVLSPVELSNRDIIELGATKLAFVPLCYEDFEWEDLLEAKSGDGDDSEGS